MIKQSILAIIGAGETACSYAKKAREKGVITHCFAWETGAIAKQYVDYFHAIDIFDKDRIVEVCKDVGVGAVVSTTELTIAICAYVQKKLGLIENIDFNRSLQITNKGWVRECTQHAKSFKHPQYMLIRKNDSIEWNIFPAIVKPMSEGGKRGVVVAHNQIELERSIQYSMLYDKHDNGVIVEQYLEGGKEYSVECLSYQGQHEVIQITEKISSGPPHCVELGHHQPALLSTEIIGKVREAMKELLSAVMFLNGPTHVEIKINEGNIFLIELNARPGGDFIADTLTELSTGYDYLGEAIKVAFGKEPRPCPDTVLNYVGVYFITKQTEHLKPIFDTCDAEQWLYYKHFESNDLHELVVNDDLHQNYLIYCSNKRIDLS